MTPNKIEIDLDKLENEISGYDKVIEDANRIIEQAVNERLFKTKLRDYLISNYLPKYSKEKNIDLVLHNDDQIQLFQVKTGKVGQPTGISDFIRDYIKNNNQSHTNAISEAYAKHLNLPLDSDLKKTVSRALTRLKVAGEINNELKEGGKRAGSIWYY